MTTENRITMVPMGSSVALYRGQELIYYGEVQPTCSLVDLLNALDYTVYSAFPPPTDGSNPLFPIVDGKVRMPQSLQEFLDFKNPTTEDNTEHTEKERLRKLWQEITDIIMRD